MKTFGLDLYNFAITGDKACNMNANSNTSASHAGPTLLIFNDKNEDPTCNQGGINVSERRTESI